MKREALIEFMKWYKNTVPIGAQNSSELIVDDYLNSINEAPIESQNVSDNEVLKKHSACSCCGETSIDETCYDCDMEFNIGLGM